MVIKFISDFFKMNKKNALRIIFNVFSIKSHFFAGEDFVGTFMCILLFMFYV